VKFVAVGIEDVRGLAALRLRSLLPALAGGVVDGDAGLDVVHIDIEADAFPLVLHRPSLHLDTAGYQVLTLEHRGHPVEDVVVRLLYIVRHQIFKGQHPVHIHIAGAGDEIFLVGVLSGELKADQVTAVVQVLPVVLPVDPAGGCDGTDALPVLCGHQILSHVGIGYAAAAQSVQLTVRLKGHRGHVLLRKIRLVAIDGHVGLPGPGGNSLQRKGGDGALRRGHHAAGEEQAQGQQRRRQGNAGSIHGI